MSAAAHAHSRRSVVFDFYTFLHALPSHLHACMLTKLLLCSELSDNGLAKKANAEFTGFNRGKDAITTLRSGDNRGVLLLEVEFEIWKPKTLISDVHRSPAASEGLEGSASLSLCWLLHLHCRAFNHQRKSSRQPTTILLAHKTGDENTAPGSLQLPSLSPLLNEKTWTIPLGEPMHTNAPIALSSLQPCNAAFVVPSPLMGTTLTAGDECPCS
eukprot:472924-Pleurochrysis_carterae.AAC.2